MCTAFGSKVVWEFLFPGMDARWHWPQAASLYVLIVVYSGC